jgi:type 1 fimbria pilin
VNIDVSTSVGADKSVTCDIDVDGQHAAVTFADGEVSLSVLSGGGEITFTVPQAIVAVDTAG